MLKKNSHKYLFDIPFVQYIFKYFLGLTHKPRYFKIYFNKMSTIDYILLIVWILFSLGLGIWAGVKTDLQGFWVNNRSTRLSALVFTIVGTQVGGGATVGIVASSYSDGTGFGLVALISTATGFLLLAFLAPKIKAFGDKYEATTLPEVFKLRYSRAGQAASAFVIFITYISLLSGQFLAINSILQVWTDLGVKVSLFLTVASVILYGSFAGLRGDIVTDVFHFGFIVFILFFVLTPILSINEPILRSLQAIPSEMWSPITFAGYSYVVVGIMLGALIPLVGMEMWMRIYSSRTQDTARNSFTLSAIAIVPIYLLAIFLGLLGSEWYPNLSNPDILFAKLFFDYLPSGFMGIGIGGLLAIFISTANTMMVVLGATLSKDILPSLNIGFGNDLNQSRILIFGIGILGALLALSVPSIVQQMLNAFFVLAVLSPAVIGLFWKNATSWAAAASIIVGVVVTIISIPFIPRQAYVPGIGLSFLTFFAISFMTTHSENEESHLFYV